MIRIVTRADDAGMSVSANKAVRAAFEEGILRNASLLAPAPAIEDAAERLIPLKGLCFGLHSTVTSEWDSPRWGPVLPPEKVPTLLDEEGMLHRHPTLLHDKKASAEEMLAEIAAQLEKVRSLGFDVKYIDTHMDLASLQGMKEGIPELARREGLVCRPKVDRLPKVDRPLKGGGEFDEHDRASRLLAALEAAGPGAYITVGHPAFDDEETRAIHGAGHKIGEIAKSRDGERLMFMREDVVAYCKEHDIQPIRYDEV